jgi:hypothetical protein
MGYILLIEEVQRRLEILSQLRRLQLGRQLELRQHWKLGSGVLSYRLDCLGRFVTKYVDVLVADMLEVAIPDQREKIVLIFFQRLAQAQHI